VDDNSDRCTCCHISKILTHVFAPTAAELAKSSKLALQHDKERALALHIVRFPEALVATLEELAPHRLTEYLYDLSDMFNSFYVEHKVRYAMFLLCPPFCCCVSCSVLAFSSHFLCTLVGGLLLCGKHLHRCMTSMPHTLPSLSVAAVWPLDTNAKFPLWRQVIGSPEEDSRLLLCEATAVVMRQCFSLLGIKPLYRI